MELDPERVIASITGRQIVGGEVVDGGMHFELDDGRLVIFAGTFVMAVAGVARAVQ